jgi:hypothetical protein
MVVTRVQVLDKAGVTAVVAAALGERIVGFADATIEAFDIFDAGG